MHIICYICKKDVPITFKQDHHKRPQAAGGGPADEVELCAGCHHNLHRISDLLLHSKAGLAEDSAKIAYPDLPARERLFELAQLVVEWMVLKKDGKVPALEEVALTFTLPFKVRMALQLMANEMRGPTGRKMGMAYFVRKLVSETVYRRYPNLRPPAK